MLSVEPRAVFRPSSYTSPALLIQLQLGKSVTFECK